MEWNRLEGWLNASPLWLIASTLYAAMCIAAYVATVVRRHRERVRPLNKDEADGGRGTEGYIVSAVLGLLALLLGFTFSLAVDRFDARRLLVLQEANAIDTAYLRSQLLNEPDRGRTTELLVRYLNNRIALAKAPQAERRRLLAANDALIVDLWASTGAALETIKCYDWSSGFLDSINRVIELDASRKAARVARVPTAALALLITYMITTAGVLGYVLRGHGGRTAAGVLLALFTLTLVLIIDIDGPTTGGVFESQRPMEQLRLFIVAQRPGAFDRWRTAQAHPAPSSACPSLMRQ